MNSFTVKTEYNPKRCEICHKNDLFDGSSNFCLRCEEHHVSETKIVKEETISSFLPPTKKHDHKNNYDQASNYLLSFSLLFTIVSLFSLESYKLESLTGLSFSLILFTLLFSGIIVSVYLNEKIYGKTFIKMLLAIILPGGCLVVFSFVRIMSHLGMC